MSGIPEKEILTVRQINDRISEAVAAAFPRTQWVRGEIQRLPRDAARRQHLYFELHETGGSGAAEYQIPVALMGWDRDRFGLGRYLDGSDPDLQLADKLEVCFECKVDYYAKFGKLSLKIVGVDKSFSLGRLEARRREILAHLQAAGLLETNRALPLPDLPRNVGLITSPGSAAERDFMSGLEASPWSFAVTLAGAKMQGERLETEVIAGLERLVAGGAQVVVITRGGGSRADLSWFDQKELAEAIARCPVPVVTAIGHEIDRSIADLVAHHSCKTPTAAAEFLVDRMAASARRVDDARRRLTLLTQEHLAQAARDIDVVRRLTAAGERAVLRARARVQRQGGRLQRDVAVGLTRGRRRLAGQAARLGTAAATGVERDRSRAQRWRLRLRTAAIAAVQGASEDLARQSGRLGREALRPLTLRAGRLEALAVQARLLDPQRLLARGFSLTVGADGKVLVDAARAAAGDRITTRLATGRIESIVQPGAAVGAPRRKVRKRDGEEDTGQETLFR